MSKTHVAAVIDESSSMWSLQKATIDGFNEYIDELKKDSKAAEETTVSLTKFSGSPSVVYTDRSLLQVENLNIQTYSPSGSTALYDAIGLTVGQLAPKVNPDDKAIVIVLTDGYENASRENTRDDILSLIKTKENLGNWTFAYLGANQDAFAVGTSMGFQGGNSVTYDASVAGTRGTYASLAANTVSLRGKSKMSSSSLLQEIDEDETDKVGSTTGTTDS